MAVQRVEQTARLPKYQETFLADLLKQAQTLAGGTTMPYAPTQIAGLSPQQRAAIEAGMSGIGSFQPFLTGGAGAVSQGIMDAQGAGYTPSSYQEFMDPFTEDVIQQQYQDIARQGDIARQQIGSQAARSGAFGGSRQAVAEAELGRNVMEQQARTGSALRSAGFQQAQQSAQQAAQQQLRQAQLGGQLGAGLAGIGQLGQQLGTQDVNTLLGLGGLTQQFGYQGAGGFTPGQAQLTAEQSNLMAQQGSPYQQLSFLSDIFRGVPSTQQTTTATTTPDPSLGSQLLGLGIAGLGAAGAAGGVGNLFNFGVNPLSG